MSIELTRLIYLRVNSMKWCIAGDLTQTKRHHTEVYLGPCQISRTESL